MKHDRAKASTPNANIFVVLLPAWPPAFLSALVSFQVFLAFMILVCLCAPFSKAIDGLEGFLGSGVWYGSVRHPNLCHSTAGTAEWAQSFAGLGTDRRRRGGGCRMACRTQGGFAQIAGRGNHEQLRSFKAQRGSPPATKFKLCPCRRFLDFQLELVIAFS